MFCDKKLLLVWQDVSCKVGLLLLKHFSNQDTKHPNNYWGFLDMMENRKTHRRSFRTGVVMEEFHRLPWYCYWEKEKLLEEAQEAINFDKIRRKANFDRHMGMLKAFERWIYGEGSVFEPVDREYTPSLSIIYRDEAFLPEDFDAVPPTGINNVFMVSCTMACICFYQTRARDVVIFFIIYRWSLVRLRMCNKQD